MFVGRHRRTFPRKWQQWVARNEQAGRNGCRGARAPTPPVQFAGLRMRGSTGTAIRHLGLRRCAGTTFGDAAGAACQASARQSPEARIFGISHSAQVPRGALQQGMAGETGVETAVSRLPSSLQPTWA